MRLTNRYSWLTEQLSDLYQYKSFLEERIKTLESELEETGELMKFAEALEGPAIFGNGQETGE